jgi:hypothetical protein
MTRNEYTEELARTWREHAALLRRYGAEAQAAVLEQCAAEVEAEARVHDSVRVTLDRAVEITGFSRSHLRRMWREGHKVRPIGTEASPEFFLSDLPRKPGYFPQNKRVAQQNGTQLNSMSQVARAVVKGEA